MDGHRSSCAKRLQKLQQTSDALNFILVEGKINGWTHTWRWGRYCCMKNCKICNKRAMPLFRRRKNQWMDTDLVAWKDCKSCNKHIGAIGVKRLQKLEQTSDALAPLPLHSMLSLNGSWISKSRRASASSLYSQLFGSRFWIVILDLGYMLKGKAGGLSIFTAFWIMIVPLVFHFSTVTALQKGISFPCWLKGQKTLKGFCCFSFSTLFSVTLTLKTYPSHIFCRRFWQIPNFCNGTWLQILAFRLYPTSMN